MSVRELAAALARLLPDDTSHAKKILVMNRPPASLREVMEDTAGRTLASLKKEGGIVLYSSRRSRRGGFITRPQRSPS